VNANVDNLHAELDKMLVRIENITSRVATGFEAEIAV